MCQGAPPSQTPGPVALPEAPPVMTPTTPGSTPGVLPSRPEPDRTPAAKADASPTAAQTEVPSVGSNEVFSYAPSSDYEGVSIVTPMNGNGESVLVSDSFLHMTLNNRQLNDERRMDVFRSYPQMTEQAYDAMVRMNYPDSSTAGANQPFENTVLEGADRIVVLTKDSQASPYVRVSVTDKNHKILQEFSLNTATVSRLLANPYKSTDDKIAGLQRFPFRLPEKARENFASATTETIRQLAEDLPELKRQEMVKMTKVFAAERAKLERQQDEAATSAALRVRRTPAPSPRISPSELYSSASQQSSQRAQGSLEAAQTSKSSEELHEDAQSAEAARVTVGTRKVMVLVTLLVGVALVGAGFRIFRR